MPFITITMYQLAFLQLDETFSLAVSQIASLHIERPTAANPLARPCVAVVLLSGARHLIHPKPTESAEELLERLSKQVMAVANQREVEPVAKPDRRVEVSPGVWIDSHAIQLYRVSEAPLDSGGELGLTMKSGAVVRVSVNDSGALLTLGEELGQAFRAARSRQC